MNNNFIETKFYGHGYDEVIELKLINGTILYKGLCYCLVTSEDEEIELRLNYSQKGIFIRYSLKRIGKYVILIPNIEDYKLFSSLHKSFVISPIIIKYEEIIDLWLSLRYDTSELNTISIVNDKDICLLWLINICDAIEFSSLEDIISAIIKGFLAEDPTGYPTIIDLLNKMLKNELSFIKDSLAYSIARKPVIVYIDNFESELIEWKALDADNRKKVLLGNGWSIEYTYLKPTL